MSFFKKRKDLVPKVDIRTNYVYIYSNELLRKHLSEITSLPYWVWDTETNGRDPHVNKVILMQIGNRKKQFLIDTRSVDISPLKDRLEDENLKLITQFGQFDYLMTNGTFGIRPEGFRDTFLAEKVLVGSLQWDGFSMEDMALKYLHVELDKALQKSFINHVGSFSEAQLAYAALDCIIPDYVLKYQMELLERYELIETWLIECKAMPAFADSEFYGLNLNIEKWKSNIAKAEAKREDAIRVFTENAKPYCESNLFGDPDINPSSPKQVLELFKKVYGPENCVDREGKDSTGDEVLQNISKKFDKPALVTSLQSIREAEKKTSSGTYGMAYLNHIHPITQMFHPLIDQLGTETGRPAGKKPNMLNIPAEDDYRTAWEAIIGYKMLTDDYGACELRIMASMSGDPVMCKGFNEGLDYHTFTASQFITDDNEYLRIFIPGSEVGKGKWGDFILDPEGNKIRNPGFGLLVKYEQVTKLQRDVAKTINFGLAYGMGAKKLADTLGISIELARSYIKKFNETFKVLVTWLKQNQELALVLRACSFQELEKAALEGREPIPDLAYAETALGRKRFFVPPKAPPVLEIAHLYQKVNTGTKRKNSKGEMVPVYNWVADGHPALSYDPMDPWDENLPLALKKYYQRRAGIMREGGNSPIQGGNADITKIAMYEIRKWIRAVEKERNNGEYLAHIALQVYDELLATCPDWLAPEMAQKMDELMRKAGERIITKVPVATGCVIADCWQK